MTSAPAQPSPSDTTSAWRAGVTASLPMAMAMLPFGAVCGATAVAAGLDFHQSFALSWMVYAGSAQIVAVHLLTAGAPFWVILLTSWLVNLRFMIYSAAVAPCFVDSTRTQRTLGSYLLVDQSFATAIVNMAEKRPPSYCVTFCLGLSVGIWVEWQLANLAGILLGTFIPPSWSIDFVVPLMFMALIVPLLENRLGRIAAVAGAAVALAPQLPFRLNLMVAALAGASLALVLERTWMKPTSGR